MAFAAEDEGLNAALLRRKNSRAPQQQHPSSCRIHQIWGWGCIIGSMILIKVMVSITLETMVPADSTQRSLLVLEEDIDLWSLPNNNNNDNQQRRKKHRSSNILHLLKHKSNNNKDQQHLLNPATSSSKGPEACTQELHDLIDLQPYSSLMVALPENQQRPSLPTFIPRQDKGGGVIVFWHLAKTGGTTVRRRFTGLPGVDYMMLISRQDYEGGAEEIARRLTPSWDTEPDDFNHSRNHTLFAELHGLIDAPTLHDMESHIQIWRTLSKQHDIPLFVFTLFREPTSHSISYFNFFHQQLPERPPEERLRSTVTNRQCHMLASVRGSQGSRYKPQICANLYDKLLEHFDWIGTTENMTHETMPLLEYLMRFKGPEYAYRRRDRVPNTTHLETIFHSTVTNNHSHYNVAVASNVSLHRDDMSSHTLEYIRNKTCLDRGLWERIQRDFTLDLFPDDIPTTAAADNQ